MKVARFPECSGIIFWNGGHSRRLSLPWRFCIGCDKIVKPFLANVLLDLKFELSYIYQQMRTRGVEEPYKPKSVGETNIGGLGGLKPYSAAGTSYEVLPCLT